jgi:SlyX protein
MTAPNSELSSRIDELESRLAFQDDVIEALNTVVSRQDHDLAMLTLRLQELSAKINEISEAAAAASTESEAPPHY